MKNTSHYAQLFFTLEFEGVKDGKIINDEDNGGDGGGDFGNSDDDDACDDVGDADVHVFGEAKLMVILLMMMIGKATIVMIMW
jgi:hypothetical protein